MRNAIQSALLAALVIALGIGAWLWFSQSAREAATPLLGPSSGRADQGNAETGAHGTARRIELDAGLRYSAREAILQAPMTLQIRFHNRRLQPGPSGDGIALIERLNRLEEWPIQAGVVSLPAEVGDNLRIWRLTIDGGAWTYPDLDVEVEGEKQDAEVWPGAPSAYSFVVPGADDGRVELSNASIGGVRFGHELPFGEVLVTSPFAVPFTAQHERWFDARSPNGWARFVPETPQVGLVRELDVRSTAVVEIAILSGIPIGGVFFLAQRDVSWAGEVFQEQRGFAIRADDWLATPGGYRIDRQLEGLLAGEYRALLKGDRVVPEALEPSTFTVLPGGGGGPHTFELRDTGDTQPVDVRFVLQFREPLAGLLAELPWSADVFLKPEEPEMLLQGQPKSVNANLADLARLARVDSAGHSVIFKPAGGAVPGRYSLKMPVLGLCETVVVGPGVTSIGVQLPPFARVTIAFDRGLVEGETPLPAASTNAGPGLADLVVLRTACGGSVQLAPNSSHAGMHRFLLPWGKYQLSAFPHVSKLIPATIDVHQAHQHFDVQVAFTVARQVHFQRNGETLWVKLEDVRGLRATRIGETQPIDGVGLLGMRPQTMTYHGVVLDVDVPGSYLLELELRGADGEFTKHAATIEVPGGPEPAILEF